MKIYSIKDLDDMKVIKWRLTDFCNYHCSYCIRRPIAFSQALSYDMECCNEALPHIISIAKQLSERFNCKVKIDLIGGEISCSDTTKEIIAELASNDCIGKINITTNLSRNIEWYKELTNYPISITASFHPEEAILSEFLDKALTLSKLCQFKCETVITKEATHIDEFVSFCEDNGIYYMCEENLFDETLRGQARKNIKETPRYLVNDKLYFNTRNEFIKKYGDNGIAFNTTGFKCSKDYDYVYVDRNKVVTCFGTFDIKDYNLNDKPRLCEKGHCTLCGHISLNKCN